MGRMRAVVRFIGHLFLRRLLSARVIASVLRELVLGESEDPLPEESAIEGSCDLLIGVARTLEATPTGEQVIQQVCGRLLVCGLQAGPGDPSRAEPRPGRRSAWNASGS